MIQIIMREVARVRCRVVCPFLDAIVGQSVHNDGIILSHQSSNHAKSSCPSGRKYRARLFLKYCGEFAFKLQEKFGTANRGRRAGAMNAAFLDPGFSSTK